MTSYKSVVFNLLAFLLLIAFPANLFAWGGDGHKIVARIAEMHLTEKTRNAILSQKLLDELPDGFASCKSKTTLSDKFACVANWADAVRKKDDGKGKNGDKDFLQTNNWHFVDISLKNANYLPARDCKDSAKKGLCGIKALDALIKFLMGNQTSFKVGLFSPSATDFDRRNALRFIIHLVGDLHQPLHTVEEGAGENAFVVTYLDQDCKKKVDGECVETILTNLHHVWDSDIISTLEGKKNEKEYAELLNKEITAADKTNFAAKTPIDWLLVTHKIAIADFPRFENLKEFEASDGESYPKADSGYVDVNAPLINLQLKKAGIRLAKILNQIFDPK